MKAPRVLLFALSLLITQALASQSITKSVIGTSGLTQSNDHFRLSWSVGEPVVGTMTNENRQLVMEPLPPATFQQYLGVKELITWELS